MKPATMRRWGMAVVCLGMFAFLAGCNPATIALLVSPFVDDSVPPKFKIAVRDKEMTVAIVAWFSNLEVHPDLIPADTELADKLATAMRLRFKENKEKVKILSTAQVRNVQNRLMANGTWSPAEVGSSLKADYVIALEINNLGLFKKGSYNLLFQGNTDVQVSVYDVNQSEGEKKVFDDVYHGDFPRGNPMQASDASSVQFRALFLSKVAGDLSRLFCSYPREMRMVID